MNMVKEFIKTLIRWSSNTKILAFPRRIHERIVLYALQSKGAIILSFVSDGYARSKFIDLIMQIRSETKILIANNEAYSIFMTVERTKKIEGAIAEVGVYRGGSAKLICEAKGDRPLYLFDTFEGIPVVNGIDEPYFHEGQFAASLEEVESYLKGYENVYLYKGLFPASAKSVDNQRFSFINLDVDTYESTRDSLQYFYSRMNKGGVIISHDYLYAAGVRKAVDEFFEDKPEAILELTGTQCLIVKL